MNTELIKAIGDLLDEKLGGLGQEFGGLRQEFNGLRQQLDGLRQEFDGLKQEVAGLKQEMVSLNERMDRIEQKVASLELIVENELRANIMRVAEGHLDLYRKLDDALRITKEQEMMAVRLNFLEGDVRRLKEQQPATA